MINKTTPSDIAVKAMKLKVGEWFDVALNYDDSCPEEAGSWVRVEKINFFDTEAVVMGGYGYNLEVIANEFEISNNCYKDIEIMVEDYIDRESGCVDGIGMES